MGSSYDLDFHLKFSQSNKKYHYDFAKIMDRLTSWFPHVKLLEKIFHA